MARIVADNDVVGSVKDVAVLTVGAAMALAVILNANKVAVIMKTFGDRWIQTLRVLSGTDPKQRA